MIDQKFRVLFQISQPANIPQKWFSTQKEPFDVRFQMRLTPTKGAFYFWKNLTKTMVQSFKVFLKDYTMGFAWFLHKLEAFMAGVCLIWDLTSKGPFWALNHFWGIFGGGNIWKTTVLLSFCCKVFTISNILFLFWSYIGQILLKFIDLGHLSTAKTMGFSKMSKILKIEQKLTEFCYENFDFFGSPFIAKFSPNSNLS